ncbi:MAG: tripartite tricarboxylate transporter substrate binding protein [Burkholderiales bacterium]|nr:tripartite tricarboxylate transporter substrate binding protein [Burkholderiales bacterium]
MLKRIISRALAACFAIAAFGAGAQTQWPYKPVRVINPFPAGGGVDTFARPIAAKLTQVLGQNFYVENMGGAGGTVGAAAAAKQAPDGYTIFMGAIHHAIAESLYTRLTYGIEKDFDPVTIVALVPNVIVMHPKHDSIRTYDDLLKYLKANPGKLNFGSAGNGTSHHLVGELFKMRTGTDIVHVPYKGAGPMMADLLAGNVDMAFDGMGTSANQIKAGKLRPLAVSSGTRNFVLPDIPTLKEMGLQDFEVTTWYAMWVPKGTPREITDRLYQEVVKILQMPDIKALWETQGAVAGAQPPAEFARFQRAEIERWGKVVRDAKIKIDN